MFCHVDWSSLGFWKLIRAIRSTGENPSRLTPKPQYERTEHGQGGTRYLLQDDRPPREQDQGTPSGDIKPPLGEQGK